MLQPVAHPAIGAVTQGTPSPGVEPMAFEEESPSLGEPTPAPEAPNTESTDPKAMAQGLMAHPRQMVLLGPLVYLLKEEGLVLTDPSPPK